MDLLHRYETSNIALTVDLRLPAQQLVAKLDHAEHRPGTYLTEQTAGYLTLRKQAQRIKSEQIQAWLSENPDRGTLSLICKMSMGI